MTVAICPLLTRPTSDSLNGTTTCICARSLRTANDLLVEPLFEDAPLEDAPLEDAPLEDVPLAPAPPAPLAPPLELVELLAAALLALVVPVALTDSPTWPDSDTIVPLFGAYSFVPANPCSALRTLTLALLTAARAEARLASRVAALCVSFGASVLAGAVVCVGVVVVCAGAVVVRVG
ncbi:MAG: hypothetical protein ACYDC2_06550, partial [Solirubrobacteraceae bacterium]